ncbi:MAG: methyltransferase domain-containing protein [Planctomycetia bacterium]|nr:methyltransferase domain-containing protein [Planctomycetia bacterium]
MHIWAEYGTFFREFRRHFRDTGSVLPSGLFLARALTTELRKPRAPARILEVGPGTGSVTQQILRHLLPGDRFDAVELNGHFVALLQRRFDRDWEFRSRRSQVRLIHSAVEDLAGEAQYDFIISGLPFNNFPASLVREVFQVYDRLLRPGGTLSYYEYALVRQLKTPFVDRSERRRLFRVGRLVNRYIRAYQVRRERVLVNVPPAIVRHLKLKPATEFAPLARG